MEFSQNQLDVINIKEGYNMVLAGPGCGKTEILAERIARAVENGLSLDDLLCLTFTNRAARGMFNRIKTRLDGNMEGLFVGNIHRYCSRFLFENALIPDESAIIDEQDSAEFVNSEISDEEAKQLIGFFYENEDLGLIHVNWHTVNQLFSIDVHPSGSTGLIKMDKIKRIIVKAKTGIMNLTHVLFQVRAGHPEKDYLHRDFVDSFVRHGNFQSIEEFKQACIEVSCNKETFEWSSAEKRILAVADRLLKAKLQSHLYDFDDLLIHTYDAYFHDNEQKYKRYPWIQVDEIQDLSPIQLSLVDLFTDKRDDFVVLYLGDEYQAIYSFMGASLSNLEYLKERCLNHIFHLNKNYRSPKYLLDLYNEYAVKELNVDKDFLPQAKDNAQASRHDICLHIYREQEEETSRIRNAILPYLSHQLEETTAILVSWNNDATELSEQLTKENIPHFKISGTDTFQAIPMRTLLAHLNVVFNEFNPLACIRILKKTYAVDTYKQGRLFLEKLRNHAMSFQDLLLDTKSTTYLSGFCNIFDKQTIVVFDTETTGVDIFTDDIVQIAAVKIKNGEVISNSNFNVFLQTEKTIPEKLGDKVNPMVEAYKKANKLTRHEGLRAFLDYAGDCVLMGHNVNFDYHILKNNLKRDCPEENISLNTQTLDTLKLAHLLFPHLRKYKLEYLLEKFNLSGENSHMADDDIIATCEVAKFFRKEAESHLPRQQKFIAEKLTQQAINELDYSYKECYWHTFNNLYDEPYNGIALVEEMKYAHRFLQEHCEIRAIERFYLVLDFLAQDVIKDEPNILYAHLNNHLLDLDTYREGDLCDSPSFKEKLFISTVHKAKGLEFDNVVVMRAVVDRYPHFAHKTHQEQDEDKRLFYVALSRAKKRLVVSGFQGEKEITPYIDKVIGHFCVRFLLYNGTLVEIYKDSLRLVRSGKTTDIPVQPLFATNPEMRNPLHLRYLLLNHFYGNDLERQIAEFLERYGIKIS